MSMMVRGRRSLAFLVIVPSKSVPMARSTSALAKSSSTSGSCGGRPTLQGSAGPSTPRELNVVNTGAWRCDANEASGADARASTTPPPAQMAIGPAELIKLAAWSRAFSSTKPAGN